MIDVVHHVHHHVHHVALAATVVHHRLFLTAPRATPSAAVGAMARWLRRRGHDVTTPYDVLGGAVDQGEESASLRYARVSAFVILDSDAVVLAPGWKDDVQTRSTAELAEAFQVPTLEWSELAPEKEFAA